MEGRLRLGSKSKTGIEGDEVGPRPAWEPERGHLRASKNRTPALLDPEVMSHAPLRGQECGCWFCGPQMSHGAVLLVTKPNGLDPAPNRPFDVRL